MVARMILMGSLAAGSLLTAAEWSLSGGDEWNTARLSEQGLHFTGNGGGESRAVLAVEPFEAGGWYELRFELRARMKHREWPIGTPYVETPFRRLELWKYPDQWRAFDYMLRVPERFEGESFLAIGQLEHTGDADFRDLRLCRLHPVPLTVDGVALYGNQAVFGNTFYANEDRVSLGCADEIAGGGSLILHYRLPERPFTAASWRINGSNLRLSCSSDGVDYLAVADHPADGARYALPEAVLGSGELHLKLEQLDPDRKGLLSFSRFQADFEGEPLHAAGRTFFLEQPLRSVTLDRESGRYLFACDSGVAALEFPSAGLQHFSVDGVSGRVFIPEIFRSDYGQTLAASTPELALWSADAGYRVGRERPLPAVQADALSLELAKNESESLQLVLRSPENRSVPVAVEAPVHAGGGRLEVELHRVDYLFTAVPTDETGVTGWWPDPLTPLAGGLDLEAGFNQPLMVTVTAPADAAPGLYHGGVRVDEVEIPLQVRVFDFALPDTLSCTAVSELNPRYILETHRAEDEADRRAVFESYLAVMARHHVDPYDPTPFDQPAVAWSEDSAAVDFSGYERELLRVLERYHFKRFTVKWPLPPGVDGLDAEMTPAQERAFADAIGQYQEFYRRHGLLDHAFVYIWDEPHPAAFPQVDRAIARIRRHAPDLRIMLTPFWVQERWTPNLDIWAFLSHHYVEWAAQACRDRGEELWWYVCTGPRAPYATGFIDHPASELRTWLWQTRQYRLEGTLIWSAAFWCNATLPGYPARNPYLEPMLTNESGGEFGNGDGMLLYPPLAGFDPDTVGTVFAPPVTSQRLLSWRDGLEDFEYFRILGEIDPESPLLDIPESVSRTTFDFSPTPEAMKIHRAKIAAAIETSKQ